MDEVKIDEMPRDIILGLKVESLERELEIVKAHNANQMDTIAQLRQEVKSSSSTVSIVQEDRPETLAELGLLRSTVKDLNETIKDLQELYSIDIAHLQCARRELEAFRSVISIVEALSYDRRND